MLRGRIIRIGIRQQARELIAGIGVIRIFVNGRPIGFGCLVVLLLAQEHARAGGGIDRSLGFNGSLFGGGDAIAKRLELARKTRRLPQERKRVHRVGPFQ